MTEHSGYFVSAPWRSSGKTIFSVGMAKAATRRKHTVQSFKKGPDYIDPLWLAAASGRGCYNLDPYIQSDNQWIDTFNNHNASHTLALVEGTMGLHDGLQSDGTDSNASVARTLDLSVILVVDCRGMHRTVAALINGIQQFDPIVRFAGVVLNRIRSSRHEGKIQAALEQHSNIKVLGSIPETGGVHIDEKQLGLTPVAECGRTTQCIDQAADLVSENCDLDHLLSHFDPKSRDQSIVSAVSSLTPQVKKPSRVRVAIARDEAFHFYYQDDLDVLSERGVELIEVSPMKDVFPADIDGFIIGGGFPERHAHKLADNHDFREGLRLSIASGLVVHAECAGLMYLCKRLWLEEHQFELVGAIDGDVRMCKNPQGRGYMRLRGLGDGNEIRAHEFHHSEIIFSEPQKYMFTVLRGHGIDGHNDGIQCGNVHASYAHFRHTRGNPWIDRFMQRVKKHRVNESVKEQSVKEQSVKEQGVNESQGRESRTPTCSKNY